MNLLEGLNQKAKEDGAEKARAKPPPPVMSQTVEEQQRLMRLQTPVTSKNEKFLKDLADASEI